MKGSLSTIGDVFVYKVCERAGDGEDIIINIEEAWIWEMMLESSTI